MMSTTETNNSYNEEFKKPDISELNGYYTDADSADQEVFAEMRSNVLLASGDHYSRVTSRFYKRIRDTKELSNEQKLRLTKNHIQKICKIYVNNIMSTNPGVGFSPKDENSNHDMKVAELHHSVWRDGFDRYNLEDKQDDWCDSFIEIGEVAVKLFYDPNLGALKGYGPKVDVEGNPVLDELGAETPDTDQPMFEGEFVFEEIYGFNLLRPPECKDLRKAEWLGIRKMSDRQELLRRFRGNDKIKQLITADQDETYLVFDALNGGYKKSGKQTMIREFYFRPSLLFPKGYYYITTKAGILDEGELPGGHFPIIWAAPEKIQTTPRGRSPIKTMRPYQVEINRAASKIAEHHITLGDDKLLIQNGTKISAGSSLPGVRSVNYTGQKPEILAGRSGAQYLEYMNSQILELYNVMMVAEDSAENQQGNLDPYILLFRSARQKKKFQRYIKRFEKFLVELCHLYIKLCKIHLPDDAVILAIGKNEQINIPEFRQYPDTCYEVKIEAQSDDIETKLGKQIVMNHALQYVGPKMERDDIGRMMRAMPFGNFDEGFSDLTMDYDSMQNDILALDRGEKPPINQYDNHKYCVKWLTFRTRKADFKFLPPNVQQNYFQKISLHEEFEAKNQLSIQRAAQGFIPTGGYLVTCDFYVKDPSDPTGAKTRRAKVPYQAMEWLLEQMESQGANQQQLEGMSEGAMAQISEKMGALQQPQNQMQPGPAAPINNNRMMPQMAQPM